MATRILSVGYVPKAGLGNYSLEERYDVISAKDTSIEPQPSLLQSGVDIGLMRLHIYKAPERRKWLGLREDRNYEIMVVFAPLHLHSVAPDSPQKDVMKPKYAKFFNIGKDDAAGGFTYKKMFSNLQMRSSLSLDVQLTEIDNDKLDPDGLEVLLNDTSIGTVLDLSPVNPKQYLMLASNIVGKIQEVFGCEKAGDDPLWDDTLVLEPRPTIPGSYRLREGFYAIVEGKDEEFSKMDYHRNALFKRGSFDEIDANYLVFSMGRSVVS